MDEPLASVDAASAKVVMDALRELRAAGRTVVMVHHDLEMAREIFDWVVLLAGRVVGAGPVSEVMTERNLRLAYGGRLAWPGSVPPAEAVHGGA
jgi:manganese/zinc/iron transport system ATP- binding protein